LIGDLKKSVLKLVERINSNYDTKQWSNSDTKSVLNKTNDVMYTPLTYYNTYNESESSKFKTTLLNKIKSFTTITENKDNILKLFNKTTVHKDLEGKIVV